MNWSLEQKEYEIKDSNGNRFVIKYSVGKWTLKCLNRVDLGVEVELTNEQYEALKFWMVCG